MALFVRGQALAQGAGLLLVDTKYEFGLVDGELVLIDEMHTPDSSRYWLAESVAPGGEPENYDKEFMRHWYAAQGYRGDGDPPRMPADFVARIAARYIETYERADRHPFCARRPTGRSAHRRQPRRLAGRAGGALTRWPNPQPPSSA